MILRLEAQKDGLTRAWLYQSGRSVFECGGDRMAEVAEALNRQLKGNWRSLGGIYILRGPAGYSRLRSTHSFVLALRMALNIPLQPYLSWRVGWPNRLPRDSNAIKPVY